MNERDEMRKEKERKGKEKKKEGKEGSRGQKHVYRLVVSPNTNASLRLYRRTCTSLITGTNESYEPVQISVFPVVNRYNPLCKVKF
jgi:hypothetical protein